MSDTLNAESVEHQTDASQSAGEDYEAKASRMGWKPEAEFDGDKSKWIDAETFVKRGEQFLPFLQANNKALEKANRELETKYRKLERAVSDFREHHTKTEQRAYERAVRDLQARQDEAVQAGDVQEVRAITQEIADLTAEATPTRTQQADPNGWTPDYAEAVDAWKEDNEWYGADRAMTAFINAEDQRLAAEGMPYAKRFKELTKLAKAEFPHKFENPNRSRAAAVSDGSPTSRRSNGRSYSDLPPEAKAACDKFVKNGLLTRDQYLKDYDWG